MCAESVRRATQRPGHGARHRDPREATTRGRNACVAVIPRTSAMYPPIRLMCARAAPPKLGSRTTPAGGAVYSQEAGMGCLFAIFAGCFPRLGTFIIWLARPECFSDAFNDSWFVPLIGVIFLPLTTLMYVLVW